MDTYPPGTALGTFAGGKVTGGDSGREPYISFEETGLGGQDDLTKQCHLKINHFIECTILLPLHSVEIKFNLNHLEQRIVVTCIPFFVSLIF